MAFTVSLLSACQPLTNDTPTLTLIDPQPRWQAGQLGIDAGIAFDPGPAIIEALHHGVVIPIRVTTRVDPRRPSLASSDRTRSHRFEMRYLPLTQRYELRDVRADELSSYPRLSMAVEALARARWMSVQLDQADLEDGGWLVEARVDIDRTRVPSPMRLTVWLERDWRPGGAWQRWQVDEP